MRDYEKRLQSVALKNVMIQDPFWSKHVSLVKNVIIPYQWDAINDRIEDAESSHSLENFKIAAGRSKGEFYGAVFQDTDVAKWLEAVGFTLETCKDSELEKTADEVIDIIAEAQCEDGYINTYFTIKEPEKRWKDLCAGHELYTAGHLMEAAVAYYQGTGKTKFLNCMEKFADLICDTFGCGKGQCPGYPGHQEVEIGLIKLYRVTGKKRYLDTARYFIESRGVGENYFLKEMKQPGYQLIFPEFNNYDTKYSQSHIPVKIQKKAEGHAVRAVYMYCAMADLAYEYEDEQMLEACEALWDNITKKRMYITGGIGSSGILERFTTDYDLPNEYNYAETCAAIGLAFFAQRMFWITRDSKYMDIVEKELYNNILSGIALDGKSFFYVNPLEVWPAACMDRTSKEHVKSVRQKWFGVACCPPNIARTLASLGQFIYGVAEDGLYINLFVSNDTSVKVKEQKVAIKMETKFPWENTTAVSVKNVPADGMKLAVRIPEYAKNYTITMNGAAVDYAVEKGYAVITLTADTELVTFFEAPAKFVRANPKVRADAGKTAIMRGPVVYCIEEIDNGENLSALYVDTKTGIQEEKSELFKGCVTLTMQGKRQKEANWTDDMLYASEEPEYEDVSITAVPYAYWNNRGEGEMAVWMKEWM